MSAPPEAVRTTELAAAGVWPLVAAMGSQNQEGSEERPLA